MSGIDRETAAPATIAAPAPATAAAADPAAAGRRPRLLVGLALDGVGLEPHGQESAPRFDAEVLASTARRAEQLGFGFLTLDDPPGRWPGEAPRPSSVDALAFLARRTAHAGLIATAYSHYAEPFHTAKEIATLDFLSGGRAGLIVRADATASGDHFFPATTSMTAGERTAQATEFAEVLGELWDSWEDGAVIRDTATGRYVDNRRVHRIGHAGRYFRVAGPLITPRPPQGHPPVLVEHRPDDFRLADGGAQPVGAPGFAFETVEATTAPEVLEAVLARIPGEGIRLLRFSVPAGSVDELLATLELPAGVRSAPGTPTPPSLAERLGSHRRPSRFAETG